MYYPSCSHETVGPENSVDHVTSKHKLMFKKYFVENLNTQSCHDILLTFQHVNESN